MKVSLIGAGPGDPGLITVKGKQILQKADTIVYDALANPALLQYAKADAELIYVGKVADKHALPQEEINALLASKALEGKYVARLKGGDPYIFGRGGEEGEYLLSRGIPYEEIPGISSAVAAPAYAGIPVTHRNFTSALTIITGHEASDKNKSSHNWKAYAESGATLVFVMGMKNLADITENLIEAGMNKITPSAIIYRGTTPFQRVLIAPLDKIAKEAQEQHFTNPSIIVIGEVVLLHKKLDWFTKKPLLGRTIVVTRAREQASEMAEALQNLGANVIQCPTIKIVALEDYTLLDTAIDHLGDYSWVIFTSVNGVKYFWRQLSKAGKDSRALGGIKIAAIGPATQNALNGKGINPDMVPRTYVAESVAESLIRIGEIRNKSILLPRAEDARNVLPKALVDAGAIVDVAPAYRALPESDNIQEVKLLLEEKRIDCISFGSSSTVRNFFDLIPVKDIMLHPEVHLAAIGPVTAKTLTDCGLKVSIEPGEYTIPSLINAITGYFSA